MHVFVTGGTGLIGSAVVAELLGNGHTVLALARSDASALAVEAAGAEPLRGDLADLDSLRAGAAQADGVIHLAFATTSAAPRPRPGGRRGGRRPRGSGRGARGQRPPLRHRLRHAVRAGPRLHRGRPAADRRAGRRPRPLRHRPSSPSPREGVRSTAVRLPRTVHNDGRGGFAGLLTEIARRTGVSGYPGDGTQRWPAVHALDAAVLFRLALELAPAGTSWHAVADEGDAVRDIAAVIGRRLGLPVEAVPQETYGPLGPIFAADQPSSSAHTREALGWKPTHPSLLEDLENIQP